MQTVVPLMFVGQQCIDSSVVLLPPVPLPASRRHDAVVEPRGACGRLVPVPVPFSVALHGVGVRDGQGASPGQQSHPPQLCVCHQVSRGVIAHVPGCTAGQVATSIYGHKVTKRRMDWHCRVELLVDGAEPRLSTCMNGTWLLERYAATLRAMQVL